MLILNETGKTVDVGPFTESLGSLKKVKVVDCAIAHDCPYSGNRRLIIMYNALYVPEMHHNLVPPFVVRRKGNVINDVPKIQCRDPTEDDHAICFADTGVRITLQLINTTSYFDSVRPTLHEVTEAMEDDTILELNLEEDEWDPHNPSYAREESLMLDFEGKMIEQRVRDREILRERDLYGTYKDEMLGMSAVGHASPSSNCVDAFTPGGLLNLLEANDD